MSGHTFTLTNHGCAPLLAPAGGATLTLRASGTEPKLKYYLEVLSNPDIAVGMADKLASAVGEELVQAHKSGLRPPPAQE